MQENLLREIDHIHGDHLVDIPFPKKVRHEIVAAGRAQPHHILSETGWVSFYSLRVQYPAALRRLDQFRWDTPSACGGVVHLKGEEDVEKAIALLRESFKIAMRQKSKIAKGEDR